MIQRDYQTSVALVAKQGFNTSEFVWSAVQHAYLELMTPAWAENIGSKPHDC